MSQSTPWAIDDLIVCDNSDWLSSLVPNALGLPGVTVKPNLRTGRWPIVGAVDRAGRKLTMFTVLHPNDTSAVREVARLQLLQKLNYEREATHRLVGADGVIYGAAPAHVLLACGPMNVWRSDDGTWYVGDLLQRYDGTLAGGWWTEPDSGIQIAAAATNQALNPSAGAATNYAALGGATATISSTYSYRGDQSSFKVVTTAAANDGLSLTLNTLASAVHYATIRTHGEWSAQEWSLDNSNWGVPTLLGVDGDWRIYGCYFPAGQANGSTTLYIRQSDATARTLYIDCVQVEATAYPTPYVDGALGLNHSWSGTAHASTSSRTAASLKFTNPLSATAGTLALTWTPEADYTGATRYLFSEGTLKAYFNSADDKIYFTDGTNTISTAALTFDGYAAQRLAFTWSSAGLKIYRDDALAASGGSYTEPALGTYLYIGSDSSGANQASGWIDDLVVLDAEATTTTIAQLGNGALGRARWLDVICEGTQTWMEYGDQGFVSSLIVNDDIRWNSRDGDVAFWRVYDDTGTFEINNAGDDDAYPVFHFTSRTAKTSGLAYSRNVFIIWKASGSSMRYPVRITLPDLTGKALANGDDIRVTVDGTEVDRWLDGTITGYNVWVNLNFSACPPAITLTDQVLSGDTVTTLKVQGSLKRWPSSGTIMIDSEVFVYTGKTSYTSCHKHEHEHDNTSYNKITGVTRASKNTAAATHAAGTAIYLVQRDIVITYGDATATAPTLDNDYKPAFELDHSTNTSWVYEAFGDDNELRSAAWTFVLNEGVAEKYTADRGTNATPWAEAGVKATAKRHGDGGWKLYNPCGLTNIGIADGEYYGQSHLSACEIKIKSSNSGCWWSENYELTLTCDSTWRSWSQSIALTAGAKYVMVKVDVDEYSYGYGNEQLWGEFSDATITLNSSYTPSITLGSEIGSGATFAPMLTNVTTGEYIMLSAELGVDLTVTVDTEAKTVTLGDGSKRLDVLTLDSTRREWLRLVAGVNQLSFSDTGTEKLDIEVEWNRRYFE